MPILLYTVRIYSLNNIIRLLMKLYKNLPKVCQDFLWTTLIILTLIKHSKSLLKVELMTNSIQKYYHYYLKITTKIMINNFNSLILYHRAHNSKAHLRINNNSLQNLWDSMKIWLVNFHPIYSYKILAVDKRI